MTIYIIFQEGLTITTNEGRIVPSSNMAISRFDASCLSIEALSLLFGFGMPKTINIMRKSTSLSFLGVLRTLFTINIAILIHMERAIRTALLRVYISAILQIIVAMKPLKQGFSL